MNIEKKIDGERMTLALAGRLDTNTAPELEGEMKLEGVKEVVFDLAALEYISSAGLRVFLTAKKAMMACGGKMSVINPNATVKGVFDITGCSDIFGLA